MNLLPTDGAPAASLGNKGDFAFDPKTRTIYGPKDTATWPSGQSFDPAGTADTKVAAALNLPTVDPAVLGALWNDAGTVKVSAGP